MKIDEKMQQEGSKNDEKSSKIGPWGVGKSKKMGAGGASKRQQNAKLEKNVDPFNSIAPFLSILVENGSQDGGQNPLKIDQRSIENLKIFSIGFWMHFGRDLGANI